MARSILLAVLAGRAWEDNKRRGVAAPQATAFEDVGKAMEVPAKTVELAFRTCRGAAEHGRAMGDSSGSD
jgi:hypothetical protein